MELYFGKLFYGLTKIALLYGFTKWIYNFGAKLI